MDRSSCETLRELVGKKGGPRRAKRILWQIALTLALCPFLLLRAVANPGDETCFPRYRHTGATPGTANCPTRAATSSVGLGTTFRTVSGSPARYCGMLPKDFGRECRIDRPHAGNQ